MSHGINIDRSPTGSMDKKAHVDYLESAHAPGGDSMQNLDATIATEAEHDLTFWVAFKKYRKSVMWSMIVCAMCCPPSRKSTCTK